MTEHIEDRWQSPAGDSFGLHGWPSGVATNTLLLVHHGLGEHAGRYQTFANNLVDMPIALWSYDARGHGHSVGKRGDADGLEAFATDLDALLPVLQDRAGADRVVLFGHSMGAAVIGRWLTTREVPDSVVAAVLSAPPVQVHRNLSMRLKIGLGRIMSRISPALSLANEIDSDHISSVRAEVERYLADPLVHDRLSVRLGLSLIDDAPAIVKAAGRIDVPGLLYHGLEDRVVDIEGTRALSRAWGHADIELHEFEGLRHECHHEHPEGVQRVFGVLRDWISARVLQ